METIEILYSILLGMLIIIAVIFIIIGIYLISILLMIKKAVGRLDHIAFNVLNVKALAKMGALGLIGKIIGRFRKGGGNI